MHSNDPHYILTLYDEQWSHSRGSPIRIASNGQVLTQHAGLRPAAGGGKNIVSKPNVMLDFIYPGKFNSQQTLEKNNGSHKLTGGPSLMTYSSPETTLACLVCMNCSAVSFI